MLRSASGLKFEGGDGAEEPAKDDNSQAEPLIEAIEGADLKEGANVTPTET